jgi:hypothetical protein
MGEKNQIPVLVEATMRGGKRGRKIAHMDVMQLSNNVYVFLTQLNGMVEKAPESVGKFKFVELEVYAEINASGQLLLLGTGGTAGATGGLKFVFRKEATRA